ncbi:DUF6457 domain-containing protein [Microbacterium sp. CR_7]|uniref:DUF6457 domain-containing protein n=1 Tax=Microbacterium sp. CR_7 TaxID=3055792 RepID=UPI0035C05B56
MTHPPQHLPPEALAEWTAAACAELGLDPDSVDIGLILGLARDVAHGVARPAAPLSAYLVGLAAGRAGDIDTASATAALSRLAATWRTEQQDAGTSLNRDRPDVIET